MGGLGDHAGEMIYILLAILLIVAVMVIVMTLSKVAKKNTNQKVAELGNQVEAVDKQFYEDWDMGEINGSQLKILVAQARDKDCAMLISTLSLMGLEPKINGTTVDVKDSANKYTRVTDGKGAAETTFNGTALLEAYESQLPMVKVSLVDANKPHKDTDGAFTCKTALGSVIRTPVLVNYGAILSNAVSDYGKDEEQYTSTFVAKSKNDAKDGSYESLSIAATSYDDTADKAQEIAYKDGRFYTKLSYATSQTSEILRYDNTTDFSQAGKTMYIADNAKFKSYILMDQSGNYLGLVFLQKRG
jgi:hypothetical protein